MKTYATREEAISAEIIIPAEAIGIPHAQITVDVEAIADEILSGPEDGYALKVDPYHFRAIVQSHERTSTYRSRLVWLDKDIWTGWTTYYKKRVLAYVLVVKEEVNEDEAYKDGDWVYGVEEMFYSTDPATGRKKFYRTGNWREFDTLDAAEKYILKMVSR